MSSLLLRPQFDTAILNPRPPAANDSTCIGTSRKGLKCKKQLSYHAIQRVNNFVSDLRYTDPRIVGREHLTLGERGSVLDCFCSTHMDQSAAVMWAWLAQIQGEGLLRRAEEKEKNRARVELWLQSVDPVNGEGPVAEGD